MMDIKIITSKFSSVQEVSLPDNCVLFHGVSLDDRGENALSLDDTKASARLKITYYHESMRLSIGSDEIDADNCDSLLSPYIKSPIVFEATTLGLAELYCAMRSVINLGVKRFDVLYGEPAGYTQERKGGDSFALSNKIVG